MSGIILMAGITLLNAVLQSPRTIQAELSADWMRSRMPNFYIDPGKGPLDSVRHADFWEFAETSAYFISAEHVHFYCSPQILSQSQLSQGDPVYLAGDFNGWDAAIGDSEWLLEEVTEDGVNGLTISVPIQKIDFNSGTGFKFVSHEGHWFSVRAEATNVYLDSGGTSNYYIDRNRSGRHLLIVETEEPIDLAQDYFLVLDAQPESAAAIAPGDFFLKMGSQLSLGALPHQNNTLFRIFAPRASTVELIVLETPYNWDEATRHPLIPIGDGVWEVVVDADLTGKFYWYRMDGPSQAGFSHFDPEENILDPYALAVVNRLGPAIVVDTDAFEAPSPFKIPKEKDLVIGEAHLRDLIAKAPIKLSPQDRLGYRGLIQWLQSDHCYLKEWGVNAVELQPIQENDAHTKEEYHWGYMTVNYFSPESTYASDPLGASQVGEFKELVEAFHEAGLAVILDVVYNHVGEPAHLLFVDKLYYFELQSDGTLSNWSGCGNDLRCSTPMGKRLIIDSLLHMIEFYGVDGFRFDLAELIGLDSLREVENVVREKHPDVILIAEPWSFRGHLGSDLKHTHYLSWNDGYRDFLKHYILGKGDYRSLRYFLQGSRDSVARPSQTVNYTESHDDRTWLDDITLNTGHNGYYPTPIDRRRTHLMLSILMMSHGTPMLAQGQDFLRSKWGVKNTYQLGDINGLDYQRQVDYAATHSYSRDWIEFRKSESGELLRLDTFPEEGFFEFYPATSGAGLAVFYNANRTQNGGHLLFVVNPMTYSCKFKLDDLDLDSNWVQVADSERFDAAGLETALIPLESRLKMPSVSCALWISSKN